MTNVAAVTASGDTVAVLGLAYKDNTPVVEESAGAKVAAALVDRGRVVVVHDPIADASHSAILRNVTYRQADDLLSAVTGASALVIVGDDPVYDSIPGLPLSDGVTVVDCWRRLATVSWPAGVAYHPLGLRSNLATGARV